MPGKVLKEPLLHFLIAGGLLFAIHAALNRDEKGDARSVRVTAAEVDWLTETWTRQWQRPPGEDELRGLVADYVKEVLLAREAVEMGLDVNDTIVRRRLAQKMEFIIEDTARFAEPDEAELRRLFEAGGERYQSPPLRSFTQIFFKKEDAARAGLKALETEPDAELGDGSLLEREHVNADRRAVESQFGSEFAASIFALEPGGWRGPVVSAFGYHLVRIDEIRIADPRPFEDAREQVLAEWHRLRQVEARAQFMAALFKKYEVIVDESVKPHLRPLAADTP